MGNQKSNKRDIIGVTGFIGSGKSRASHFLAESLGCLHVDADKIAREIMDPGKQGWSAIKKFDPKFITAAGQLNRVLLRDEIFSKPKVKAKVDALIHPLVQDEVEKILESDSGKQVVVEVPLLFEAGWEKIFTRIVLVYADKTICLKRVVTRDHVNEEQAEKSYQSQMGTAEKISMADHVVDNSGSWWNTQLQVMHLIEIFNR